MEAIVLAGGLGTRLQSVLPATPKALSPVAGRPFLSYIVDYLLRQGVDHFIFSVGHLSEQVIRFLEKKYSHLSYDLCVELTPLGTGGAIKKAMSYSREPQVLVLNADTFFDIDLSSMFRQHGAHDADCTIGLKQMKNFDRYGTVVLGDNNRVVSFKEKCYQAEGLINGGYYIFRKQSFPGKELPEVFSIEKDFLEQELNALNIQGFISGGYFIDIGIPSDFEVAQRTFAHFNDLE
jgi:D-glycero-alpha-D-manno-heptose 1-phosphate guanylyltransferase